jgi:SAM-dependent methyltransferase
MKNITIDPAEDVFLDYGCGKGRAVVLAATHPFRKVMGVELSADLCERARDNLKRAGKKLRCKDVEIVNADAAHYRIPAEVSVIFLWNSFFGQVLIQAIEQVRLSLAASPRRLRLINASPHGERDVLQEYSWLTKRRELPAKFWTGVDIVEYEADCDKAAKLAPADRTLPVLAADSAATLNAC